MIMWEAQVHYKNKKNTEPGLKSLATTENGNKKQDEWDCLLQGLNRRMGKKCDPKNIITVYVYGGRERCLEIFLAYPIQSASLEYCFDFIRDVLETNYAVCDVTFKEYREISGRRFDSLGLRAEEGGYIRRWIFERSNLEIDYFSNSTFMVEEFMEDISFHSKEDATKAASKILGDQSLMEELERIYSDENEKTYRGHPVHYKISASNSKAAMDVIDVLVPALLANHRLVGKRIVRIFNISEGCYNESELEHLFRSAQGNTVMIELSGTKEDHGNFATSYHRVIDFINSLIVRYHLHCLCFFVEVKAHPGFSKSMIAQLREDLQIININEGCGDRKLAKAYLKSMVEKDAFTITEQEINAAMNDQKIYRVKDIYDIYDKWFKNGLRTHVYKAYKYCDYNAETLTEKSSAPYDELQEMVGLTEIKKTVDQIIETGKIRKLRTGMGLHTSKASLHMIFTGNPGSAKTTVARLITQILRKEDILDSGNFVECGRADLIGKYVGWTAKQVRSKFMEASGGVLFIDEAYSLIDDSHSFADEAINTIVQEMENHREDVIVIFAGYPEKMKDFLNKNEGLRSRIAFHLDFPDYTPDELSEILQLMAKKRGFQLSRQAVDKCHEIFENACSQEHFGNGRFVRTLIEQAEMAQSHRLVTEHKDGQISKKSLQILRADDFDVNITKQIKPASMPIGFAV